MKKQTKVKFPWGTLRQIETGLWRVSWTDIDGKYRRIRFESPNLNEAIAGAERIIADPMVLNRPGNRRWRMPAQPDLIRISDMLARSAAAKQWQSDTAVVERKYAEYFLQFVDRIGLHYWEDLRYEHVEQYIDNMQKRDLSAQTIIHYMKPVRRAAMWASQNWPERYRDICAGIRLKPKRKSIVYDPDAGNPALSIAEVLDLVQYFYSHPIYHPISVGVALQGLCGLQLKEAYRLRWNDVDLANETITIHGEVKNAYRVRQIPVPSVVLWLLRNTERHSDQVISGYKGYSYYSMAVKRCMYEWNPEKYIAAKDLRNTIQTAAVEGGWYGYYLQRYVGHSPRSIGERHYVADKGETLLRHFRDKVLVNVEEQIRQWAEKRESTGIVPGPRFLHVHCTG